MSNVTVEHQKTAADTAVSLIYIYVTREHYSRGAPSITARSIITHLITTKIKYKLKHPQYSYNT